MSGLMDFQVEILKVAPGSSLGPADLINVTDRALVEDFGSINRAVDRDLLSFKTGDVTLGFWNTDGFMTDLFHFFGVTDRWQLRIFRRGAIQFWGVLIGQGSIHFDKKERTCEVSAYGLTRMLNDVSAETVQRTLTTATLGATLTTGNTTITVNTTSGLLAGDILHVTDHIKSEDLIVKQVTSGTVASLEAAALNTYSSGSSCACTTPYYRYKPIDFLVGELLNAAAIPLADLRISNSQFNRPAPTPINLSGLDITLAASTAPVQKGALRFQLMHTDASGGPPTGTMYSQATPSSDWVTVDTTCRAWIDWTRYYIEGSAEPAIHLRAKYRPETETATLFDAGNTGQAHMSGWDFVSATKAQYYLEFAGGSAPANLARVTSADGITWGAQAIIVALPDTGLGTFFSPADVGAEFDLLRGTTGTVYCSYAGDTATQAQAYDLTAAAFTSMKQADDDATTRYFGFCYQPDHDYTLCLRGTSATGPSFEICAFRGTARLWKRPFPPCTVQAAIAFSTYVYPTQTLRQVNGVFCCIGMSDGAIQFISSDDEFQTYAMRPVFSATTKGRYGGARINGSYCFASYKGSIFRGHIVAAPFYAGVIDYADHEGLSVAEALKNLAVLANALFWVDDDGQAHFVARDIYDAGAVLPLDDNVNRLDMDRVEDPIWEESISYIEVSGGGFAAVSGLKAFAASGLSLDSPLIPNDAFAQALADSYFDFYGLKRSFIETTVIDGDGHIYQPLDRVSLDGIRYLIYESDHNLIEDEVSLQLLEDA